MNPVKFQELNLPAALQRAIDALGFDTATEIQSGSIPLIRAGRDVIGRSQTGTGKTIAFGLPAIEQVNDEAGRCVQVLILCPTRELAVQAGSELRKLARYTDGINITEVYGGASMENQIRQLKRANIVVGTPGRVMDHMRRRTLKLQNLKMIVLDEADEMLSMGFRDDIETILKDTPEGRQTLLFSATMPPEIMRLTREYQNEPEVVAVNPKQVTVENIEQSYCLVPSGRKLEALCTLLREQRAKRAIIFTNTKRMVDQVVAYLKQNGVRAEGIHGDMRQTQRLRVMDSFKRGRLTAFVATDVAARGIDVNDVDFVFNFDVPQNPEYYVHRIGRTGRAGKSGRAITLCASRRQVQDLLAMARALKAEVSPLDLLLGKPAAVQESAPVPEKPAKQAHPKKPNALEGILEAGRFDYEDLVAELMEKGYPPSLIAAAALQFALGAPAAPKAKPASHRRKPKGK